MNVINTVIMVLTIPYKTIYYKLGLLISYTILLVKRVALQNISLLTDIQFHRHLKYIYTFFTI